MAIHCTMTYFGEQEDGQGMPRPWFHYLVVASPWVKPGSGSASIIALSEERAKGVAQGPAKILIAKQGGPEEAVKLAGEFLDKEHKGLKKIVSDAKQN